MSKQWTPDNKQQKHLELVMSMTTDCLMDRGTDRVSTYTANLRRIADLLDEQSVKSKTGVKDE